MRTGKKALLTSVSKSFKHVSVFLLSILLARYLTLDAYGSYLQVMLISNTAIYFSLFGVPSSIYYFMQKVSDKRKFLKRSILIIHVLGIISSVLIVIFSDNISQFFNNRDLLDVAFLCALFVLFQIPIKLFEPIMISTDNIMGFVKINLFFNILFFFVIAIPLVLYSNIVYIYYSMLGFFGLQYLVIYISITREYFKIDNNKSFNVAEQCKLSTQLKYSLPIGASGAISELSRIVDKIIVSNYFTPAELAIYARGAMEIPMLNVVINSLGNILMPKFVSSYESNNIDDILNYWHRSTVLIAFVVYPLMVLMIAIGDILIPMLFTDKFNDSIIIFQIYTCALIFRITTYDSIIRAIGKTAVLLRVTIISLFFNIALTILFVENFGIYGVPVATLVTVFIVRIEMLRVIKNMLNISFSEVFPWSKLFKILVVSMLPLILVIPFKDIEQVYFVKFMMFSFSYGVGYLILSRMFFLLGESEINALSSILPKKYLKLLVK